jgi:putative membrane protein
MHAVLMLLLHGGVTPFHHLWTSWEWAPGIVLPLVAGAVLYARGVIVLHRRGRDRSVRRWEVRCFSAGLLITALALMSPLHALSEQLFSAHMVQHELLMVVAAPLLVLGRPLVPMLWALSPRQRTRVGTIARSAAWRRFWRTISHPASAWLIQLAALWIWHLPRLFQATLDSESVHAAQHASFFLSALLFWWAVLHTARSSYGASVLYLFTTLLHSGALGALLTFSRTPWYPEYVARGAAWYGAGMGALEDQQIAGLIMWVPAGIAYLVAALLLLAAWMRQSEARVVAYQNTSDAGMLVRGAGGRS